MITVHTIYNYPPVLKGNVRDIRVLWALEELGLPYQFQWMDFSKGEHRGDVHRLLSPFGKVPAIEDGAQRMFESGAIVLYLYENAGKAPQDAHARAEVNQWAFAALNTLEPIFFDLARWELFWKEKTGRDWRYADLLVAAKERLDDLTRVLGGKQYLVGNAFGPADILMTAVLDFGKMTPGLFDKHAVVQAYRDRCHARPAYGRAAAVQGTGPQANAA